MANDKKMVEQITSMDEDFAKWYTDIVKKADINRGTFYAHYDNVSDVVASLFQHGYEIITNSIHDLHEDSDFDMGIMLKQIQQFMEQNYDFYHKIFSSDTNMRIYDELFEYLANDGLRP